MKISEAISFFVRYVRNPSSIGAVCPSSRFLAQKMVAPAKDILDEESIIVELGSGTGAITKYILSELNILPKNIYCVEFDKASVGVLSEKFPHVNIANDSAENLVEILGNDVGRLKCVISCLPLLSLPDECASRIINKVEDTLQDKGIFVQFTYNLFSPSADKYIKTMTHIKTTYTALNIPPARVDVYVK